MLPALADAFDLGRVQGIDFASALMLGKRSLDRTYRGLVLGR
jgi:hypothetical protein